MLNRNSSIRDKNVTADAKDWQDEARQTIEKTVSILNNMFIKCNNCFVNGQLLQKPSHDCVNQRCLCII